MDLSLLLLAAVSLLLSGACLVAVMRLRRKLSDLQIPQAHLECLFETFPEALMLFGTDGTILRANARLTEIFGYSVGEVLGKNVDHLLAPGFLMPEGLSVGTRLARGETVSIESRRRHRDGHLVDVAFFGSPIQAGGRHVASYGLYRDLMPRLAAEAQARESQRLLELFFSQSMNGFFFMMLDEPVEWNNAPDKDRLLDHVFKHLKITRVNDAMLAQYQLTREQMLGMTPEDFYAHDPAHGRAVFRQFLDAGRRHTLTFERRADGTPIRIEGDYLCLYDELGRLTGHFGIQRDVTERYQQEEALRQSEEKFAKAFRSSPFPITIATLAEGRFVDVNEAFLKDVGYPREEVIGRTALELGLWMDPARRAELVYRLERDGMVREFEFEVRNRRNEHRINVLWAERITVGDEACMLDIVYDVTDRKRDEEALRRSGRELRALAARQQTVREEERTRIAREFHDELGQALTGLKLDLSWVRSRLVKAQPELADGLQSAIGCVDATVDKVRRIATELRPGVLDLLGLVAAIEWQAHEFSRRTGLAIELDLRSGDSPVDDARATNVFRILQEALTNVARHAEAARVSITYVQTQEEIRLEVADDGRGIDPKVLVGAGSLGLVGIRERAIACGGELTIDGEVGRGTTVRVRIPAYTTGAHEVMR